MRLKATWTPGGIVLWLIAAIAATLIVCVKSQTASKHSGQEREVEVEVLE